MVMSTALDYFLKSMEPPFIFLVLLTTVLSQVNQYDSLKEKSTTNGAMLIFSLIEY